MKRDPLDEARDYFVDGLIEQAIDNAHQRHMEEKGRLLKERCAVELGNLVSVTPPTKFSPETNFEGR